MNVPGYISAHELYRLGEAQRRLRLGRHSFRTLREAGLQILKIGRCHYIDGAELIGLIKRIGEQDETKTPPQRAEAS
jgi:hypothetical protein